MSQELREGVVKALDSIHAAHEKLQSKLDRSGHLIRSAATRIRRALAADVAMEDIPASAESACEQLEHLKEETSLSRLGTPYFQYHVIRALCDLYTSKDKNMRMRSQLEELRSFFGEIYQLLE